jgi:hypothetical protein
MLRHRAPYTSTLPIPDEAKGRIWRGRLWPAVACLASVAAIVDPSVAWADEAMQAPLLSYQVGEDGTVSAFVRGGESNTEIPIDQRIGLPLPEALRSPIEEVLNSGDPTDVLDRLRRHHDQRLAGHQRYHCHAGDCHCHPPCCCHTCPCP